MTFEVQTTDHETVKLPNALTVAELMGEGKSLEQAQHIMRERVFGVNYSKDKEGQPVENGLGSALQPTKQHLDALKIALEREAHGVPASGLNQKDLIAAVVAAVQASGGSNSGADVIAQAVAAGVQAGLAAAKEAAEL